MSELAEAARRAAETLQGSHQRVVFAESCTAGLASASLAAVPGISEHHCGSAVTYRNDTKHCWLGVRQTTLDEHTAVSAPVAQEMAQGVLSLTPEATIALSITGHLGPQAPAGFDGLVFIGVAVRDDGLVRVQEASRVQLTALPRLERQREAATRMLERLATLHPTT